MTPSCEHGFLFCSQRSPPAQPLLGAELVRRQSFTAVRLNLLASLRLANDSGVDRDKRVYEDIGHCPFVNHLRSTQWGAELCPGEVRAQLCQAARLLVWRRCRLCPNNSAGPLKLFTGRNQDGFWRRSCTCWEIWIWPKRPCTRHSPPLWSPGPRVAFLTSHATARFKAIDGMRWRARFDRTQRDIALCRGARINEASLGEDEPDDMEIEDDRLRLIFTCCHPALPPEGQVALTLRGICGLTTEEIAQAFLVTPATLAQRIVRAKAVIRDKAIPYQVPVSQEIAGAAGNCPPSRIPDLQRGILG